MSVKVFEIARRRLVDIWHYTEQNWGEEQASRYIDGLFVALDVAERTPSTWHKVNYPEMNGLFFIRYRHHVLFFRVLPSKDLGLLTVLHARMDLPERLLEDVPNP